MKVTLTEKLQARVTHLEEQLAVRQREDAEATLVLRALGGLITQWLEPYQEWVKKDAECIPPESSSKT